MLPFRKYHGLGNDFVLLDLLDGGPADNLLLPDVARRLCDRHFGVGADGVLYLLPSINASHAAAMRILNADGSEAEMCGNGIRCVAKHLHDHRRLRAPELNIETAAGLRTCALDLRQGSEVTTVAVEMGAPALERPQIPMTGSGRCIDEPLTVGNTTLSITAVSMGNPHAVAFVDDEPRREADRLGSGVENHPAFPRRANAGFARMGSRTRLELVVWERGCGITMACGTGACAAAVAAVVTGRAPAEVPLTVALPGGELQITVARDLAGVTMGGPVTELFTGEVDLHRLRPGPAGT